MLRFAPIVPLILWVLIYPARMLLTHQRFASNAYDLSIFDYALWNLPVGGYAPFMGKSVFSDHAMPTFALLWPVYVLSPGPALLIAVQAAATLAAAVLLLVLMRRRVSPVLSAALVFALLFGRRSHSAIMSMMYPESLEPALVLGMILAWQARRWRWFAACVALALGCKEDVGLYVACFGALIWWHGDRRAGLATAAAAVAWMTIALTVLVPWSRRNDQLATPNLLWEERYPDAGDAAARAFSLHTVGELAQLAATSGFISLAAPQWLAIAAPGAIANVSASPEQQQAGLTGHYFWALMPWLFAAAVFGAQRVETWNARAAAALAALLIVYVAIDSPLWRAVSRGFGVSADRAAAMRQDLRLVPDSASVTAMANLVPHLPHRAEIYTFGLNQPHHSTEYLALSLDGDLWPLSREQVRAQIACLANAAGFERVGTGTPAIFRRTGGPAPLPTCGR